MYVCVLIICLFVSIILTIIAHDLLSLGCIKQCMVHLCLAVSSKCHHITILTPCQTSQIPCQLKISNIMEFMSAVVYMNCVGEEGQNVTPVKMHKIQNNLVPIEHG